MSSVDDSEVLRHDGVDPSATSGRPAGRISRRGLVIGGGVLATVASVAVGLAVNGAQHHGNPLAPAVAVAATQAPAVPASAARDASQDQTTAGQTAHGRTMARDARSQDGDSDDPPDPNGSPPPDPSASPHANENATPSAHDRILADQAAFAEREEQAREADEQAREDDARKARSGGAVLGSASVDAQNVVATAAGTVGSALQKIPGSYVNLPSAPEPDLQTPPPLPPSPAISPGASASTTPPPGGSLARATVNSSESASPAPYTLTVAEGDMVDVILQPNVDTDRRGIVNFYFAKPVTDSDTGSIVLIPQYARAVAKVLAASINDRVVALSPEKVRIDGKWVDFSGAAQDANGDNGMSAHVNDHRGPIFILSALAGGLAQLGNVVGSNSVVVDSSTTRPPVFQEFLGGVGTGTLNATQQLIANAMNRPPSLTIQHATAARFILLSDISLPPYCVPSNPSSSECRLLAAMRKKNGDF